MKISKNFSFIVRLTTDTNTEQQRAAASAPFAGV
jgi:hypothetical protein